MPTDSEEERARKAKIAKLAREAEVLRDAALSGRCNDVIYHCKVLEWLCMPDDLMAPPPSPELGKLLDITTVAELTKYSKSRIRHIGHTLPGYFKFPTGKVGWWSGPLEAAMRNGTLE
jgi:hypothetical protein